MQINFSSFEEHLSRKDKKDTYSRPLTALLPTRHARTHTDEICNLSFLTRRKDNQGYTTRLQTSGKSTLPPNAAAYRNIRSASLYETLYPHMAQERPCKLQIINNACLKKVFLSKPSPFRKNSSVYDVNATLGQHIEEPARKENQLPKYHCKKLKVIKGKPRPNARTPSDPNNEEDPWGHGASVTIIGTKLL